MKNNIWMPLFSGSRYKIIQHNIRYFHFNITLTQSWPNNFSFVVSLKYTTTQYSYSSYCLIVRKLSFILVISILLINYFRISDTRRVSVIFLIVIEWYSFAIKISALNSHLFFVLAVLNCCTFHSFSYFNYLIPL